MCFCEACTSGRPFEVFSILRPKRSYSECVQLTEGSECCPSQSAELLTVEFGEHVQLLLQEQAEKISELEHQISRLKSRSRIRRR